MSKANSRNGLLALAKTSVPDMAASSTFFRDFLSASNPTFGVLQSFFSQWFKLDVTVVATAFVVFGALSGLLQTLGSRLYWTIVRFFTASVSIASNDRLNREVLQWVSSQVLIRQGTRVLTARSETVQNSSNPYRSAERNDLSHEKRLPIQYLPSFGTTWFVRGWRVFMVRRISNKGPNPSGLPDEYGAAPEGDEPLVVMCLGLSVDPIKRLLDTCRDFADKQKEMFTTVRASRSDYYHSQSWDMTVLRAIRPLETVHFDEKTKAELVADITNYLDPATRRFYVERGIPYRRGYLLHGPPGTGKTSLSLALAGHFSLDLYLLHLPSIREDTVLERLFASLPPKCIVLIEDIDAVGMQRNPVKEEESPLARDGRCSLSGLLNVLDGVASQEGRIILMTSNFADKLDRALVRPGRIDRTIYLGHISPESARLMFLRMYTPDRLSADNTKTPANGAAKLSDKELETLAATFSLGVPDNTFTPAQIQGYLLKHGNSPSTASTRIGTWAKEELVRMEEAKQRAKEAAELRARQRKRKLRRAIGDLADSTYDTDADEPEDTPAAATTEVLVKEQTNGSGEKQEEAPSEKCPPNPDSDGECNSNNNNNDDKSNNSNDNSKPSETPKEAAAQPSVQEQTSAIKHEAPASALDQVDGTKEQETQTQTKGAVQ